MTWLPLVVALIALLGVILTNVVAWRNNRALDAKWRAELSALESRTERALESDERKDKRAKALDVYKWAAELAVSDDPGKAQTGVDALAGLLSGNLLDEDMKLLVDAALGSAIAQPIAAIESAADAGVEIQVVQVELEAIEAGDVPWGNDSGSRERGDDSGGT